MMKKLLFFLGTLFCFNVLFFEKQEINVNAQEVQAAQKAVKLIVGNQEFPAVLYDSPAANALYARLPLTLKFEDFNGIEKIAYMDDKLPTADEKMEFDPNVGDICLYAPWGNLSLFYKDFRKSQGLVSLGHLHSGIDFFARQDKDFTVRIEAVK